MPVRAKVRASNPSVMDARYHAEGNRTLADEYDTRSSSLARKKSCTVLLATGRLDGRTYVVKRFHKLGMPVKRMELVRKEVEIHLSVDHPHIAALRDVYSTSKHLELVMECCAGGELFDRVVEQGRFSEADAGAAMRQMLLSIAYLHAHKIVHRDLKLESFLYQSKDAEAPLKLIDFGLAEVWGPGMPKMRLHCGSIEYISPDVLGEQGYTSKCDLWSMGVIAFILLSGCMPFSGDSSAMKLDIQAGRVHWHCSQSWDGLSARAVDFVRALLAIDPGRRLDADAALRHPWLAQLATPEVPRLSKQAVSSMREYAGASRLRRAALQLLARELPPQESQEFSQLFLGIDQTNSGTISVCELADALGEFRREQADAGLGRSLSWARGKSGDKSPSSVTTADTDLQSWSSHSSLSSSTSAGAVLKEWPSAGPPGGADLAEAEELFWALDASGDGEVYCSDFIAAVMGSRPQLCERAVQRTLARLDADWLDCAVAKDLHIGRPLEGEEPSGLPDLRGLLLKAHGEGSILE